MASATRNWRVVAVGLGGALHARRPIRGLTQSSLRGYRDGREGLEHSQAAQPKSTLRSAPAVDLGSGRGRSRMSRLDNAHEDLGGAIREGREEIAKWQS